MTTSPRHACARCGPDQEAHPRRKTAGDARVIVCGSRSWGCGSGESTKVYDRIRQIPAGATIVHGAAEGADQLAAHAARTLGYRIEAFPVTPADWHRHGKRAGILRNLAMLDAGADLVIAFWNGRSPGTRHMIEEAQRRHIALEVIR